MQTMQSEIDCNFDSGHMIFLFICCLFQLEDCGKIILIITVTIVLVILIQRTFLLIAIWVVRPNMDTL